MRLRFAKISIQRYSVRMVIIGAGCCCTCGPVFNDRTMGRSVAVAAAWTAAASEPDAHKGSLSHEKPHKNQSWERSASGERSGFRSTTCRCGSVETVTSVTVLLRPPLRETLQRWKRPSNVYPFVCWSRYRPITFTLNVGATTQHTFECPHERSKVCCDVAQTFA